MPASSIGFWVATSMNGSGSGCVVPSIETVASSAASSSADCVRGFVRFSSSNTTTLANTGPGRNRSRKRVVVGHHRAGHVARKEVGGALDPMERPADRGRHHLRQQRLADARDVLDQQVAARQEARGGDLGDLALAGDDPLDGAHDVARELGRPLDLAVIETHGRTVALTPTVPGLGRPSRARSSSSSAASSSVASSRHGPRADNSSRSSARLGFDSSPTSADLR